MKVKTKKNLTYFTISIFFLLGGIEYAVILPTLWLYLQTFHSQGYMLGLVLSSFSVSGLLTAPILGRWADRSKNTKVVVMFGNLFEIAGSFLYFVGLSPWMLVVSRFIAGIGTGAGPAIFADIARTTSVQERTGVMSLFMAVRQFGLLAGPGFNLFLRELDFYLGPFHVNKYSSPGLLMAVLWCIQQLLQVFFYWNLPDLQAEECCERLIIDYTKSSTSQAATQTLSQAAIPQAAVTSQGSIPISCTDRETPASAGARSAEVPFRVGSLPIAIENHRRSMTSNEAMESAERYISQSVGSGSSYMDYSDVYGEYTANLKSSWSRTVPVDATPRHLPAQTERPNPRPKKINATFILNEYCRPEVVVILATVFSAFFNQTVLETACTPLTSFLLNWGELQNSLLYCAAGVEIILVFVLIRVLCHYVSDRALLLSGYFCLMCSLAFLTWFVPQAKPGATLGNICALAFGIFLDLLAIPIMAVISASLYSKITCLETQGFSQGLRRTFGGLGTILGPLWAGGLLQHINVPHLYMRQQYIMFGVCLFTSAIIMVLIVLTYQDLKERTVELVSSEDPSIQYPSMTDDDTQPLCGEQD